MFPYLYGPAGYVAGVPIAVQLVSDLTQARLQAASAVVGSVADAVTGFSNAFLAPWSGMSGMPYAPPRQQAPAGRYSQAGAPAAWGRTRRTSYQVNVAGASPYWRTSRSVNFVEGDDSFFAHVELPNIDPANISVRVESDRVEVAEKSGADAADLISTVALPEGVDTENITAEYRDGILTLRLPKEAKRVRREVRVHTAAPKPTAAKQ